MINCSRFLTPNFHSKYFLSDGDFRSWTEEFRIARRGLYDLATQVDRPLRLIGRYQGNIKRARVKDYEGWMTRTPPFVCSSREKPKGGRVKEILVRSLKLSYGHENYGTNFYSIYANCASWFQNLCPPPLRMLLKREVGAKEMPAWYLRSHKLLNGLAWSEREKCCLLSTKVLKQSKLLRKDS